MNFKCQKPMSIPFFWSLISCMLMLLLAQILLKKLKFLVNKIRWLFLLYLRNHCFEYLKLLKTTLFQFLFNYRCRKRIGNIHYPQFYKLYKMSLMDSEAAWASRTEIFLKFLYLISKSELEMKKLSTKINTKHTNK